MLPMVETEEQWDAVIPDETVMRPGVEDLCTRLGLTTDQLVRYAEGSQPVYRVGDAHVLKLFPAAAGQDGVVEARVLEHVEGRLSIPTPKVHAAGAYANGWQYVLMSRLPGEGLAVAWERVPQRDRDRIVTEAGEALAALHSLDPEPLADVLDPGDWGAFVARQRAQAVERQRQRGLPESWLDQIPGFLDSTTLPSAPQPALLHTEFMREHLVVAPDGWRLTGLFDFEPAMIGDRAYDFVAVGLFVTRGDPRLLGRLVKAYGHSFDPRELMAYTLLHVYSNLPWYLKELGTPADGRFESLAEAWFGTA
ncbi:aminoglycoside phosphotransferase family protein [Streptomyces sp. T-3]|nr:aminoglycoside phosphotransferase family protein [Streptomyces sp. T-3]